MKKVSIRSLALLLTALLLLPLAPVPAAAAEPAVLRAALISDIHYYPPELAGGHYDVLFDNTQLGHPIEQTPGTLESALAAIKARAARGEIDYLLIPGDLTTDGERLGHERLAEILEQFEADTLTEGHPVQVAVVPGNHDIGSGNTFVNGMKERATPQTTYEDYLWFNRNLGYDLPNLDCFAPLGEDKAGRLSYAADLGAEYEFRLVALDTKERRITPELRAWVVDQCKTAVAAGQTVIGMGHHNLNEQLKGQLVLMQGQGIENMREISEEFADAGMHFYFSGHLHMSEISPWYSDSGQVLYDIIVPGLYSFPGDYRVVEFTAQGSTITAKIDSYPVDEVKRVRANGVDYRQPYYPDNLELSFGYKGQGLNGFVKASMRQGLGGPLEDLRRNGGLEAMVKKSIDLAPLNALMRYLDERVINQPDKILGLLNALVDDAFALPVSKLPCNRFLGELGFGHPTNPGTVADMANSAIVYMFWKDRDPADDPFMQDVLRRMKNGELLDQILAYAIPKVLDILGAEILPLLANVDVGLLNRAMSCGLGTLGLPLLLVMGVLPATRQTISKTLYDLAGDIITSASPSGRGTDAVLVYDSAAAVAAPTGPNTFRLPYELQATLACGGKSAEITWYTKDSLTSPALLLTDRAGNPVAGVNIAVTTEFENITANQIDLGIVQLMGTRMRAAKHTATITGLKPGKAYKFTAGDSVRSWWSPQQNLSWESKFVDFFRQVWNWLWGLWKHVVIAWNNRWFY